MTDTLILEACTEYHDAAYDKETLLEEQREETNKAFFAGAASLLAIVGVAAKDVTSDGDIKPAKDVLVSLQKELMQYAEVRMADAEARMKSAIAADDEPASSEEDRDVADKDTVIAAVEDLCRCLQTHSNDSRKHKVGLLARVLGTCFAALEMNNKTQAIFAGAYLEKTLECAIDDVYDMQREGNVPAIIGLSKLMDDTFEGVTTVFELFKRRVVRVPLDEVMANKKAAEPTAPIKPSKEGPCAHTSLKEAIEGLLASVKAAAEKAALGNAKEAADAVVKVAVEAIVEKQEATDA